MAKRKAAAQADTIVTTLGALADAETALRKVADQAGLPAKPRYHVAKLLRLVLAELSHWHTEREQLIREYGTARPPTTMERMTRGDDPVLEIRRGSPAWTTFDARMRELAAVSVTVSWGPLQSAWFDGCPAITPADLLALDALVDLTEPTTI